MRSEQSKCIYAFSCRVCEHTENLIARWILSHPVHTTAPYYAAFAATRAFYRSQRSRFCLCYICDLGCLPRVFTGYSPYGANFLGPCFDRLHNAGRFIRSREFSNSIPQFGFWGFRIFIWAITVSLILAWYNGRFEIEDSNVGTMV